MAAGTRQVILPYLGELKAYRNIRNEKVRRSTRRRV